MRQDIIQFEILEDGTLSVTTDQISGTNHMSADKLLKQVFDAVGGAVDVHKRTRLEVGHAIQEHVHADGTAHVH